MPARHWTFLRRREVADHRIFRLHEDRYRVAPHGLEHDFVVIDAPDWINIVPLTDDRQIVMIRQYRHGVRGVTLEIPGGMIDPGEEPIVAAARELQEETGYVARRIAPLGSCFPNPAVQTNSLHCFLAEGVELGSSQHLDPLERIEVVKVPLAELDSMVRSGAVGHALVIVALGLAGLLPERR